MKQKKYFSIAFCAILVSVMAVNIAKPTISFSENENRTLAGMPTLTTNGIVDGSYMSDFETYSTDQFFFRDMWVSVKANLEKLAQKKENNGVYFAKDDYLIEKPATTDLTVANKNLGYIKKFGNLNKYNTSLLLVPTAYEILQDKLPLYAHTAIQQNVLTSAKDILTDGIVNVVDTTNVLTAAKDDYIYYRTDHHQTSYGSYIAYRAWCEQVGITPHELSDFEPKELSNEFFGTTWSKATISDAKPDIITAYEPKFDMSYKVNYVFEQKQSDSLYDYSYLETKDKYSVFLGGNNPIMHIETSNKNDKTLAIFKDSYAHAMIPFLANHYENIHVIDLRYYNMNPITYLEENKVDDVLILYNVANFTTDTNLAKIGAFIK